jgi:hypothetical protein
MMLKKMMVGGLMVAALAAGLPAAGEARVNFSLNINAPPAFEVVPGTPVQYAPAIVDNNVFHYGGRYYVYDAGTWYMAPRYRGPWAVVAPAYVPRPLLQVPVGYYHRQPANWRHWRHDAAPRWDRAYGRHWRAEHRDEYRVYR